jgi:hypothetical protein
LLMTDLYSEARLILAAALIISPLRSTRAKGARETHSIRPRCCCCCFLYFQLHVPVRPSEPRVREGVRIRQPGQYCSRIMRQFGARPTRFLFAPRSVSSGCFIGPTHWPAAPEEGGNLPQMHANRTEICWTWLILRVLNCCQSRRPIQVQSLHAPRTLRWVFETFLSSSRHGT